MMSEDFSIKLWKASDVPPKWIDDRKIMKWGITTELETYVESIIAEVRKRGDEALSDYTKKFDGVNLSYSDFLTTDEEIKNAYEAVTEEEISTIEFMKERIEPLEQRTLEQLSVSLEKDGVQIRCTPRPIDSVGCYVPGGDAAYPSTLVMAATPARIAGVPRIVVCSPPTSKGTINPLTLVAADMCKVDEIYKIGGAQAVAALTYGTTSIKPVRKIVGPGNKYVAMAKILVSKDVAIDLPEGPSEILVLADETADPRFIALDMISQAEHGVDSIAGLITTSNKLAERVVSELKKIPPSLPRSDVITRALSRNGFIIVFETLDDMTEFTNAFAPEHLEIVTENPTDVTDKIKTAGLILLGQYTPVSASDYCIGTNHILPTQGFGHINSGLSVLDFIKRICSVHCTKEGLEKLRRKVKVLAESEHLPNHYLAVEGRFNLE